MSLQEWERLAVVDERPIQHQRTTAAPSTPAQRVAELSSLLIRTQQALAEAVSEIKRLTKDYERYHRMTDTSFGGIPMAQLRCDMVLWEALLNENPEIRSVVELGSWEGGFSWWLWAQCKARDLTFLTFDSIQPTRLVPNFHRRDVFADAEALADWFRVLEPVILLCDNGNKPREFKTFAELLTHPNTLFVVHDWLTEIGPEHVPGTVEEVYGSFCDELGSISRVFRLRREDV